MENEGPRIVVKHEGSVIIAELLDEEILEENTIEDITEALFSLVEDNPGVHLILSFLKVRHLSSSALGTLIRLNKRIEESKGTLKMCDIKPSLYEIFVITKLVRLFDIYDNEALALSSYSQR